MNALQYPEPREAKPRKSPRPKRTSKRFPHSAIAFEMTAKMMVNGVLSAAAIGAVANLLPYYLSQSAKLREVRSEVAIAEVQLNQLYDQFSRTFDPQQSKAVMSEQSGRVDPHRRRIIWLNEEVKGY